MGDSDSERERVHRYGLNPACSRVARSLRVLEWDGLSLLQIDGFEDGVGRRRKRRREEFVSPGPNPTRLSSIVSRGHPAAKTDGLLKKEMVTENNAHRGECFAAPHAA